MTFELISDNAGGACFDFCFNGGSDQKLLILLPVIHVRPYRNLRSLLVVFVSNR